MLVGSFFKNINPKYKSHFFSGLSFNSLNVNKNNIFFSIIGTKINGNQFINNAIKKDHTQELLLILQVGLQLKLQAKL